jgi:hypothetical protein
MDEVKLKSQLDSLNNIRDEMLRILIKQDRSEYKNYSDLQWQYKTKRAEIQLILTRDREIPVVSDPILRKDLQHFLKHGDEILHEMKMQVGNNDFIKEMEFQLRPEFEQERLDELADELILFWFNHYDYVYRMINTATIVVKSGELPEMLHKLINELRQCLIFGNYTAAGIILRSIAEVAINDIMEKNFPDQKFDYLAQRIGFLKDQPMFSTSASTISLYLDDLNEFVHGAKSLSPDKIKVYAQDIILERIQELYEKSV